MGQNELQFEDDKLSVAVKSEGADEIVRAYNAFGWHTVKRYSDEEYSDIVHIDFSRLHRIEGKDRLQLLQVRFEVAVSFLSHAGPYSLVRAVIIGALLALVGVALAVYGGFVVALSTTTVFFASGFAVISAGVIFIVLAIVTANKISATDKQRYGAVSAVLRENIRAILREAAAITGEEKCALKKEL